MVDVDDYERLARYQAGELTAEERASLEHELAERPELRQALTHLERLDAGLATLPTASLAAAQASALVERALRPRQARPRRQAPLAVGLAVAVFAGLFVFLWQSRRAVVEAVSDVVLVDARTLVAGESLSGGDLVVTSEEGIAVARVESGLMLLAPGSALSLADRSLHHGVVVLQGDGLRLSAQATTVTIFGEAVLSTEPLEADFRETRQLTPGDLVKLRIVGGAAVGAVVLYLLSGTAEVIAPGEPTSHLRAPATWGTTPASSARAAVSPAPRSRSEFEAWPTETARAKERPTTVAAWRFDASVPPESGASSLSTAAATSADAGLRFSFDKAGIQGAMHSIRPEVAECYEAWLKTDPDLGGRMVVSMVITPDDAGGSSVTSLEIIDGGLGHALMEGCVMNAVEDLKFESGPGVIRVRYPFQFQSQALDGGR